MKKLKLSNTTIAYRESEGKGQNLILVHGNSCSSAVFDKQLNSSLGDKYHIVALDLPGHGNSDRLPDHTHYTIPNYAAVIVEAANQLNMQDAVFAGWSLGGHIVLEAVNALREAKGFMIYGTPPLAFPPAMEEAFFPNPIVNVGFTPQITQEDAEGYANAFFAPGSKAPNSFVEDILKTDGNARAGLGASIQPNGYTDEVEIVANMQKPLAIFHGEKESLINPDYISHLKMPTLWKSKIQFIQDAGHATHWENPTSFNNKLAEFIEDCQ